MRFASIKNIHFINSYVLSIFNEDSIVWCTTSDMAKGSYHFHTGQNIQHNFLRRKNVKYLACHNLSAWFFLRRWWPLHMNSLHFLHFVWADEMSWLCECTTCIRSDVCRTVCILWEFDSFMCRFTPSSSTMHKS